MVEKAKYWLYWNLNAGKQEDYTYRVEKLPEVVTTIENILGIKLNKELIEKYPTNINTRKPKKLTAKKLKSQIPFKLYHAVEQLAQKYGYSMESMDLR